MSFIRALTFVLAAAFSGALGILAILAGARMLGDVAWSWLLDHRAGVAFLAFIGACLLFIAAHFIRLLVEERQRSLHLSHDGAWGTIALSPGALKQFVGDLLSREIGLESFRVRLEHGDSGLVIGIRTALSSNDTVTDIGERMQRTIAERVSQQIGVDVERVAITVRSMRSASRAAASDERRGV